MLVDNEPDVIELFTEILKTNGYKVLGFVDTRLAFEHLKQNQEEFELVLSDYRVRYLSGCDLVRKITEINARIKVIIITALDSIGNNPLNLTVFIKPISLSKLIDIVPISLSKLIDIVRNNISIKVNN